MSMKEKLIAYGALAFGLSGLSAGNVAKMPTPYSKYAPPAIKRGRSGAKLARKAHEGTIGRAVLR